MTLFNNFNTILKDAFAGKACISCKLKMVLFQWIYISRKYFYKKHTSLTKYGWLLLEHGEFHGVGAMWEKNLLGCKSALAKKGYKEHDWGTRFSSSQDAGDLSNVDCWQSLV